MLEQHFLHRFFNPRSIAVIGASHNPASINHQLVKNLVDLGYRGQIYPVNPTADRIAGLRAYKSINDIPAQIDLVAISIPAHNVLDVVKDLPGDRVSGVVIITGGFSEIGGQGKAVQAEIASTLRQKGIRALGPNALSPINSRRNLAISFFALKKLMAGNVSFIFQSGMYEPRFNWIISDFHLGISKLIDLGNKMDINEVDALEYLAQDPDTEVICLHLEMIKGDARRFLDLLKETSCRKPVIVLKGGTTAAGAQAAMTHTGSLVSGSNAVFDAAMKQAGVIRAETLDDFFYYAKAFAYLKPPRGNRIALATFPGGEGVLATDACLKNGLEMARPGSASYEKLKPIFPPWEIPLNPLDLGLIFTFQGTSVHGAFLEAMSEDDSVDCIALELPPMGFVTDAEEFGAPFLKAREKGKPLAAWPLHMLRFDTEIITWLEDRSIPVFPSAAIAVRCLGVLCRYGERVARQL